MTASSEPKELEERPPWVTPGEPIGDAHRFGMHITRVQLAGDQPPLALSGPGVTAVVGANNSGKSTLMRQLYTYLTTLDSWPSARVHLVTEVEVARQGSGADLLAWLGRHAHYQDQPGSHGGPHFVRPNAGSVPVAACSEMWGQDPAFLPHGLMPLLVTYADAHTRFGQVAATSQRADVADPPAHPLHHLQDDADLRTRLDELSRRIFRQPLILDYVSGNMQLRVGQLELEPPRLDESLGPYRAALAQLRPLEHQGDGMKSLLGLLLPLITATFPIILVDEPEAFLHPPQAYQLGRVLGELARDADVQLILATHDRNLLAGLLAAEAPLSVVRLTRTGDVTTAAQLDAERVAELWTDPVLRYSNVLDGLFHQLVVLAEDDRDCRFYAAALDAAEELGPPLPVPPADVLFAPSHGMVRPVFRGVALLES